MMSSPWNKGLDKNTHPSIKRMSRSFVDQKIDNFKTWRNIRDSKRPAQYFRLKRNGDLAELIGAVLGDGSISKHPRTQCLRIVSNSNNYGFVSRYSSLVEVVFAKKPTVAKRPASNCVSITIYQNNIAERLGLETGSKTHRPYKIPKWIEDNKRYTIRFLRGLYETDGCLAHHAGTYTHKFTFRNVNQSLLELVFVLVSRLGFHATKGVSSVQISRKAEVESAAKLLMFRHYT